MAALIRTVIGILGIVTRLKGSYGPGELDKLLAGAQPPTPDDVSIAADGRRLDSVEAVTSFFDEIRAGRSSLPASG